MQAKVDNLARLKDAGLESAIRDVAAGVQTHADLMAVVAAAQSLLTSVSVQTRVLGARLVVHVVQKAAQGVVKLTPTANVLLNFFSGSLHDHPAIDWYLMGILHILPHASKDEQLKVPDAIFAEMNSQPGLQPARLKVVQIMNHLLTHLPEECKGIGSKLIKDLVQFVDGEKDPRVLVEVFKVAQLFGSWELNNLAEAFSILT